MRLLNMPGYNISPTAEVPRPMPPWGQAARRPIVGINQTYADAAKSGAWHNQWGLPRAMGGQRVGPEQAMQLAQAQGALQAGALAPLLMGTWGGQPAAPASPHQAQMEAMQNQYDMARRRAWAGMDTYYRNNETGEIVSQVPEQAARRDAVRQSLADTQAKQAAVHGYRPVRDFRPAYTPLTNTQAANHFHGLFQAFR